MTVRVYSDTDLSGFGSAEVDDDIRVMRNIEERARTLRAQLDKLEDRWHRRSEKLCSRKLPLIEEEIVMSYDFRDALA